MARRYILPGDRSIARIECDINHGRDGENVPARQKRHDDTREAKGRQARTRRSPQSAIFHRSKPINEVQRKCSISDMPNIYARNLVDRMRNRRWERRAGRPNLLRFKPSFVLIHAVIQMDTISQFVRRRPSRTLASPSGAAGVRSAALAQSLPTTGTKFSVGPVGRL